jgi:hypothetical protein
MPALEKKYIPSEKTIKIKENLRRFLRNKKRQKNNIINTPVWVVSKQKDARNIFFLDITNTSLSEQ